MDRASSDRPDLERLEQAAREVLEVAIGFAVLGLNRVQVARRRHARSRPTPGTSGSGRTAD